LTVNEIRLQSNEQQCTNGCSLAGATAAGLISDTQWVYDGGDYKPLQELQIVQPWQAFWVSANAQAPTTQSTLLLPKPSPGADLNLDVTHRDGQTFVVWNEMDQAEYHIYRHTSPITNANIGDATRLTERWGPLDQNTSVNSVGNGTAPQNFVISDLGDPLRDDQGLFVHTTSSDQQGAAYYAVTNVIGGEEITNITSGDNASTTAVNEIASTPRPVLTVSVNDGKGRIYTQYMDYANWNPTLNGYAYNFAVALPSEYDPTRSYSLKVELHAYGGSHKFVDQTEYEWQAIQLFPHDPGQSVGTVHTWWYGFAADHNYRTQGEIPQSGTIENFTEQRVIAAVNFLVNDEQFNIDPELVHAFGNSMGASGVLSLGMRYPSVFAGIYASQPMTNYGANPIFQSNFVKLWGDRSTNLPIVNNGQNIQEISRYGQGGTQPTGVWNWMNHFEQIVRRKADRFSYLMVDHGKADTVIDWASQGRPLAKAFTDARVGFSAKMVGGAGHSWQSFGSVVKTVFGLGYGEYSEWRYPKTLSFPGIHFATGSGSLEPSNTGDDNHNTNIEWSTPKNNFHQNIVDDSNNYEITLRTTADSQSAHITPRNTNAFKPAPGTSCSWRARSNDDNSILASGDTTVDASRLLTVPGVPIVGGLGTRLSINCP